MLKAVLFDLDGVIVNTEPLHYEAYKGMFKRVGAQVDDNLYKTFKGKSTLEVCETVIQTFNLTHEASELIAIKRSLFKDLFFNASKFQLIDGVLDLIKDFYANDVTLVLASSASMFTIDSVFEKFDLDQYFSGKFSGTHLKQSKPHPEIFIKAAAHTGYNKNECIVIEDSTNGITAANRADIFCIGYKSEDSNDQDYSTADLVITSLNDINYEVLKTIV